jgi:transcription factor WhiB
VTTTKMPALLNAACRRPENAPKFDRLTRDRADVYLVCLSCPDRPACLEWALAHERTGFWAGFSGTGLDAERERLGIKLHELRAGDHVPGRSAPRPGAADVSEARAWAQAEGIPVPGRGHLAASVLTAWREATQGVSS